MVNMQGRINLPYFTSKSGFNGGFDMNVNNRRISKEDLTFFQWLNMYELMTKKEFKELPEYKQNNYKREFEMWQKGISQYN